MKKIIKINSKNHNYKIIIEKNSILKEVLKEEKKQLLIYKMKHKWSCLWEVGRF